MKYIINNILIYNPEDGSLHTKNMDDYDLIMLTPVLNRLLSHMVNNQGVLISKENFFDTVWDNYGRTGSANTLKQYISNLRKILDSHLETQCIITVPGQGYMLSPDLVIQCQEEKSAEDFINDKKSKSQKYSIQSGGEEGRRKNEKKSSVKKCSIVIFSLFLIIPTLSVSVFFSYTQKTHSIYLKEISKIDDCVVYGENEKLTNNDAKNVRSAEIKSLLATFNISCQKNESFYFFSSPVHEGNDVGRYSMLSVCYDKGTCISYRVNNYEN